MKQSELDVVFKGTNLIAQAVIHTTYVEDMPETVRKFHYRKEREY